MRSRQVDTFLAGYPKPVQAIAAAARAFLEDALPSISENVDESAKLLSYSYGPGYKGLVCTLIMSQTEVKLGIFRGSELPDPNRLMSGAGKVHRHVPLRSVDDLSKPGLRQLIDAGVSAWRRRNAVTRR
jgi:hypothetical protein